MQYLGLLHGSVLVNRQWGSYLLKGTTETNINYNITPKMVYNIQVTQHDNIINDATNIVIMPNIEYLVIKTSKQTVDGTYLLWCGELG